MPTIIVPTDFSENAANAIRYASQIALHGGGKLLLVHTLIFPATTAPQGFVSIPADPRQIEDCEEALQKLALAIQEEHEYAFEVKTICLYGELIPHLNELISTQAADLVVMGTRGASNFLDRLLGTNTASFIKKAECPVLVVPGHATYNGLSHIAYASDFETDETVYLKQLFQFASPFGSEVSIINVKSEKQLNIVSDHQVLKTLNKHFPENAYNVAQLLNNDVVAGIKSFVKENNIDVLAVSIQERGFVENLLHSSVTQALAYQAFVPLLALPKNPYHFQAHKNGEKKPLQAL
ncbi:universal stress protein [Rufibacter soli]